MFDTSTNTWSSSIIPDKNKVTCGCQAVSIGPSSYAMGRADSEYPSVEAFEMSMESLYPINDNYVILEGGYRSPKSLENLCIDQVCRYLPDLDGPVPRAYP